MFREAKIIREEILLLLNKVLFMKVTAFKKNYDCVSSLEDYTLTTLVFSIARNNAVSRYVRSFAASC